MPCASCSPARYGFLPASRLRKAAPGSRRLRTMTPRPISCRLLRRFERRFRLISLRRLDLGDLLLDQFDKVVDDIGVLQPVVGDPAQIDLVHIVAAAREADIG